MTASAATNGKPADWIDYRASVSRALRRRDAGETVRTCAGCRTELDVDAVTHSPKCTGEEAAPPATAQLAKTTPPPAPPAAPAPAPDTLRAGHGVARWNRSTVEEAIRAWAAAHDGRPPTQRDSTGNALLPSQSSVRETHGSWANAVEACGFPRPHRGGRHPKVRTDDRAAAVAPAVAEPTSPAAHLAEASLVAELPTVAGDAEVGGWRDRLLAEADRLEQLAAGHRQTVEAIDRMIEQALEVLA